MAPKWPHYKVIQGLYKPYGFCLFFLITGSKMKSAFLQLSIPHRFGQKSGLLKALTPIALIMGLAACATDESPPVPAPAPAGPPVALSPVLSDAASVYVDYVDMVKGLDRNFPDEASVQAKLTETSSFEPSQLGRGIVAYGAIVAMQEPSFRASLRAYAANPATRREMVNRLLADYSYVTAIAGSDMAARRVIMALASDGQMIYQTGAAVKQSAYDIQKQSWATKPIAKREERMALAKKNAVTLRSVASDESARLLSAALNGQGLSKTEPDESAFATTKPTKPKTITAEEALSTPTTNGIDHYAQPYTSSVYRALTLAALSLLGETHSERQDWLDQSLNASDGPSCLGLSKLNLYQCLAVAKPHYEDIFCMGQHVLMDTGQCLAKASSRTVSFAPIMVFNADSNPKAVPYIKPAPKPSVKKKTSAPVSKKKKS